MATNTRRNPKPEYGMKLEERRRVLRKSLDDIVDETGGDIYKQLWYRVENGIKQPHTLTVPQIRLFARALEWTPQQLAEVLGIVLPLDVSIAPDIPPGASQGVTNGPKAWHMGVVSAGIDGKTKPSKPRLVNLPSWITEKYRAEDVFVVTVEGHSMTCDDIRKSIPEGSEVYFHKSLQPNEGEVVAVWLEDYDIGVIKVYKPKRLTSVLQSYNFKHQPILIDESNPAIIQGVYIGKSDPSPLRFDV